MVAAAVRTIFAQPKADTVRDELAAIADMLGCQSPKVETMLTNAALPRTELHHSTGRDRLDRLLIGRSRTV